MQVMPGLANPYSASCIYSDAFAKSIDAAFSLTTQHRQRGGGTDIAEITIGVNHEVRNAQLTSYTGMDGMHETFSHVVYRGSRNTEEACEDGFIFLTKTRKRRDEVNARMLAHFDNTVVVQPFRKNSVSEPVTFAVGAPIMFHVRSMGKKAGTKQEPFKAVNGTQGKCATEEYSRWVTDMTRRNLPRLGGATGHFQRVAIVCQSGD